MRLFNGPNLAFRRHRDGGEEQRAVRPALKPERLSRIPLPQRNLAALPNDFDFRPGWSPDFHAVKAIMLKSWRAAR